MGSLLMGVVTVQ